MAINFPTSKDNFTNPSASDYTNSPSHSSQHANENDAIEALEDKVGIDGSADTNSLDYKVTSQGARITTLEEVTDTNVFHLSQYDTLKEAIDDIEAAGGGKLLLDGGSWEFSSVDRYMPSNLIMECIAPTTISAPDGIGSNQKIFYYTAVQNVAIIDHGHMLTLDGNRDNRAEHTYESGANVQLNGVTHAYIEVGLSENAHGDGLYLGSAHSSGYDYCEDVYIPYIDCYNSFRNGVSIISAKNIYGGKLITRSCNSSGVTSNNGVDFEPNYTYHQFTDIKIDTIYTHDNEQNGFQESWNSKDIAVRGNVHIHNIISENNTLAGVDMTSTTYPMVDSQIGFIKVYRNQTQGVRLSGAESRFNVGTILAIENGQGASGDPTLDSAVWFDHVSTNGAKCIYIDYIIAYDEQGSPTQDYALYVDAVTVQPSAYIGHLLYHGNKHTKSVSDADLVIENEHDLS